MRKIDPTNTFLLKFISTPLQGFSKELPAWRAATPYKCHETVFAV
jgi:hypothetical protein